VINVPPNSFQATLSASTLQNAFGGQGLTYATTGLVDPYGSVNSPGNLGLPNTNDLSWPRTYNASLSIARRRCAGCSSRYVGAGAGSSWAHRTST
jgi:hypothetical protein